LNDVLARHESLRTIIIETEDGPRQRVLRAEETQIELQVRCSTAESRDRDLKEFASRGFDLARDLPIRAVLLLLDADTRVILLVVHHSAADAWSMPPLLDDLSRAYAARKAGTPSNLTPLAVQYGDFVLDQAVSATE